MNPHARDVAVPNDWDRSGLPGWAYHSPALLDLEKEHVFRNHWQIAGHVSDVPNPGDYLDHGRGRRARAHRARQGRSGARLPQSVPPSRLARRRRRQGQLQERAGLPVPRLGLQSRRHAARRRAAALLPRSRQERVRPDAARPRDLDGLHLHPLPQGAAAVGRRADEAGRGRDRPLQRRRHGAVVGHLDAEVAGQLEVGARRRQRGLPRRHGASGAAGSLWRDLLRRALRRRRVALLRDLQSACRAPLERAQLHQHRARADTPARTSAQGLDLLRHLPQQRAVDHAGIRAVLSGVPAVDRRDAAARRHLPLHGREPRAGRRPLPRLPHRPRHDERGRPAFQMVERVDAVAVLCRLLSVRPRIWRAFATTTICAGCVPVLGLDNAPDEKDMWNVNEALSGRS